MSYDGEYDASEYPDGINAPRLGWRGSREMAVKHDEIAALTVSNDKLRAAFVAARAYIHGGQDRGQESQERYAAWMRAKEAVESL